MMPLLAVNDIHTYYGESHVLQGVSLSVDAGRVVALLGRNGVGKTTTIQTILGVGSRAGDILMREKNLRPSDLRSFAGHRMGRRAAVFRH